MINLVDCLRLFTIWLIELNIEDNHASFSLALSSDQLETYQAQPQPSPKQLHALRRLKQQGVHIHQTAQY